MSFVADMRLAVAMGMSGLVWSSGAFGVSAEPVKEAALDGVGIIAYAEAGLRLHLSEVATRAELEPAARIGSVACERPHLLGREVASSRIASRMLATVRLRCADGRVETVPVWFKVRAYAPALVAASDLDAGARVTREVLREEQVDIASVSGELLPIGWDPEGMHITVPLRKGTPLTRAAVSREPEVLAQQPVLIRSAAGQVKIEVMGLALQDGHVGERVQVLNLSSGDTLSARVIRSRAVEVLQ